MEDLSSCGSFPQPLASFSGAPLLPISRLWPAVRLRLATALCGRRGAPGLPAGILFARSQLLPNISEVFREYMRLEKKRAGGELSGQDLERWICCKGQLGGKFQPDYEEGEADRRETIRVPTQLKVGFDRYGEASKRLISNFSRGGVFIASPNPLPIGSEFELRIRVEEGDEDLELRGKVVTHNTGADLSRSEQGMGIQFVKLSPSQENAVKAFYQRVLKGALKKESS